MSAQDQLRRQLLREEIRQLEKALADSPDDAFGYLELGVLFAEADQREKAIAAFRASYLHRTGGQPVKPGTGPLYEGQLREAFDVTVSQAPEAIRGQTRRLFEQALIQARKQEIASKLRTLSGLLVAGLMVLAAMAPVTELQGTSGYWPSYDYGSGIMDLSSGTSGYWPDYRLP